MAKSEHSVDAKAPIRQVYDQWTQFEQFPHFMEGVEQVTQLDNKHLHWKARIGGKLQEWDAEITEQLPDHRIAWHSLSGDRNAGAVTFHRIDDEVTRIMLQLEYEPQGVVEKTGAALGLLDRQVKNDLERFKELIERTRQASGSWRGTIEDHPEMSQP